MNKLNQLVSKHKDAISRLSIFIVYFWFGIIKITGQSPAVSLVTDLQKVTLPFLDSDTFILILGIIEVSIAIIYLFRPLTFAAFTISILHMGTTFLPLIFLPATAWQAFLIPTLEAQYIIKNVILVALMVEIYSRYSKSLVTPNKLP